MVRPRFDPNANFVAARGFTYHGKSHVAGDPFDKEGIAAYKLGMLYGSRAINISAEPSDPVQLRQTRPGYFEITAPWLDEAEKVRGKQNAEKRLEELRAAGEPDSHHGVTILGGENDQFEIVADWLDDAQVVEGRDAANKAAAALRAAGPPPEHYALVEVLPVEGDDDTFDVRAPWLPGIERIKGTEAAESRAQAIRTAGPPEGFDPDAEPLYEVEEEARAEVARRAAYNEAVAIAIVTEGEGDAAVTTYQIAVPGADAPETFENEEAAKARQTELTDAGPPEGWEPPSPDDEAAGKE